MSRACLLVGWDPKALPARAGGSSRDHQALRAVQRETTAAAVDPSELGDSVIVVNSGSSRGWAPVLLVRLGRMLMLQDVSEVLTAIRVE